MRSLVDELSEALRLGTIEIQVLPFDDVITEDVAQIDDFRPMIDECLTTRDSGFCKSK